MLYSGSFDGATTDPLTHNINSFLFALLLLLFKMEPKIYSILSIEVLLHWGKKPNVV